MEKCLQELKRVAEEDARKEFVQERKQLQDAHENTRNKHKLEMKQLRDGHIDRLNKLKTTINDLQNKNDDLVTKYEAHQRETNGYKDQINDLQSKYNDLITKNEEQGKLLSKRSNTVQWIGKKLQESDLQIKSWEEWAKELTNGLIEEVGSEQDASKNPIVVQALSNKKQPATNPDDSQLSGETSRGDRTNVKPTKKRKSKSKNNAFVVETILESKVNPHGMYFTSIISLQLVIGLNVHGFDLIQV
jgi:chromosome segregation ATPase